MTKTILKNDKNKTDGVRSGARTKTNLLDAFDDGMLCAERQFLDVLDDSFFARSLNGAAQDQQQEHLHTGQTHFRVRVATQRHRIGQSN